MQLKLLGNQNNGICNTTLKIHYHRNQINKSSENIQFETNEFLDDYKK